MAVSSDQISEIIPKLSDIGGFDVKRYLPTRGKKSVGPFVFFDEMGPTLLQDGDAMDVRPHPHIGLSTLTWLIEGEILHRDSLGYTQLIRPGEVNWMTAGKGIVHSERSPHATRDQNRPLYGLQIWMALPSDKQEIDPSFQHVSAEELATFKEGDAKITLIAGQAFGYTSPVEVHSPTIYLDVKIKDGGLFTLPADYEEQAIFILKGKGRFDGRLSKKGEFLVLPHRRLEVQADEDLHFVLLGGQALKHKRYMWWNFVSTSKERIEQAKQDWKEGRFPQVPDEVDFIPLPEG
ncbi:pirin family protein [Terasakiella pusilla]|uniref:pirin family protein n=1 Tax=Terasakiella pusilla TaxID=64973 RepID=UPI00048B08D6|nr:pirin family protein [Terasakiella pusilla]